MQLSVVIQHVSEIFSIWTALIQGSVTTGKYENRDQKAKLQNIKQQTIFFICVLIYLWFLMGKSDRYPIKCNLTPNSSEWHSLNVQWG